MVLISPQMSTVDEVLTLYTELQNIGNKIMFKFVYYVFIKVF